ncbi:cytochrome P450 [Aspergillus karnatakaensis]|uniref:cytochrome P450 n=1 Tax=Aspergillus karnatakaensis TaxID=1810916 RepID=UPI003CCD3715
METNEICPIPGPRSLPLLGNILDIDLENGTMSVLEIAKTYYPVFKLTFAGESSILITSVALLSELCDETRFHKHVSPGLANLRAGTHDGLFTAYDDEKNWKLAHRLLVPAFGPLRIRAMFPQMHDIAQQLCLKWQRYGPRKPLNITDDFTRATLDTIALCAMGYRFNSFYSEGEFHPFIKSMVKFLTEAETQATLPTCINSLRFRARRKVQLDIDLMRNVSREIVNERRETQTKDKNDLLDTMLNARDGLSGEALPDESIIDNIITFLVAGHETTSGLLSFAMYYLLKTPDAMSNARHEVDEVVGDGELTVEHISKLKYLNAVFRETLRLMPTAPGFSLTPYKTEIIGGKYQVKPGDSLDVFLAAVHRDPAVYGSDAEEFRPERMLDDPFDRLPANAWKPFGNGKRSCIGRAFAWQEALMIMTLVLQNFSFSLVDSSYTLKIKESLTIKPDNLWAYATPRVDRSMLSTLSLKTPEAQPLQNGSQSTSQTANNSQPALILFGSNSGTCEALAHRLAVGMSRKASFKCQVRRMDDFSDRDLPKEQPVIVVTGSYDGKPPGNAHLFINWLQKLKDKELEGTHFAVFGCGHRDWKTTLYKIPTLVDDIMAKRGAARLAPRGFVDTAGDDPFAALESWLEGSLWPGLETTFRPVQDSLSNETGTSIQIKIQSPPALRANYDTAIVREVRALTSQETSQKIHVELTLPDTIEYRAGDHLAVLPFNSPETVQRVLSLFLVSPDSLLYITSTSDSPLPTHTPISVRDLLSGYVELGNVATPTSLKFLATKATNDETRQHLTALATDRYSQEVREKHLSLLDILENYNIPSLGIEDYIQLLPPLRPRQYTISSSPRLNANQASLTVSVVGPETPLGGPQGRIGLASNYLSTCVRGSILRVSLRRANPDFGLPDASRTTPIIMIAAGSGISPFRAFIQELWARQKAGTAVPAATLFFGCRAPDWDDLYRSEMDGYENEGLVTVFRAFSRATSQSHSCKYVQDVVRREAQVVRELWGQGAKIFVCGSLKMNERVKQVVSDIVSSGSAKELASRYVAEVFT